MSLPLGYNQKAYELRVLETKPGNAISIIECDMNVEFAAPVGYKEPEKQRREEEEMAVDPSELMPEPSGFVAFAVLVTVWMVKSVKIPPQLMFHLPNQFM
ncbi:hypothetical protein NQ314_007050 [Rhamnusium bicolor]|uniref:Ubiquitin fusion degradation protein UFD1 N-terminal subdomain 2 domain-containing protein n=1 Tax=Rhamnusium bicolor TaxID=1586634 RepID=A0AAV8YUK1_9CUCU|nr:hypothetical protein NQ314_007050 [Rhamnusium bicolor]